MITVGVVHIHTVKSVRLKSRVCEKSIMLKTSQ